MERKYLSLEHLYFYMKKKMNKPTSNFDPKLIKVVILGESERAIWIDPIKRGEKQWIAKSQIVIVDRETIKITVGLAIKYGLM